MTGRGQARENRFAFLFAVQIQMVAIDLQEQILSVPHFKSRSEVAAHADMELERRWG